MFATVLDPRRHAAAYRELGRLLNHRRELIWELAKREIVERYAGQVLGTLWAIGHPLIMVAIYVMVFGYIFGVRGAPGGDLPLGHTAFLLAGLVPWLIMSESMGKACGLIVGNTSLVKQVVFPVEVLPIKGTVSSMITLAVALAAVIVYVFASNGVLPLSYLVLPVVLALQFLLMLGVSYVLCAVSPFFRDLKDFVAVFLSMALFISPILYFSVQLPTALEIAIYLNPFSYMVWVYQDVMYYGHVAHPVAWVVYLLLSTGSFSVGYRLFNRLKPGFGDVL